MSEYSVVIDKSMDREFARVSQFNTHVFVHFGPFSSVLSADVARDFANALLRAADGAIAYTLVKEAA